ncbi:MAG: SAM-dependent methyltransferase [Candidatus Omnitrophica bacterium]|nr:SAM-dependent methyltransferase [Candidatus Omnitrophota bacterium]
MKILTPAQEIFLQSIIKNELAKNEAATKLSVESIDQKSIVLSVQRGEDKSSWQTISSHSAQPRDVSNDEAIRKIFSALSETGSALLIEQGKTRQRIKIEKGKIVRENVVNIPSPLKEPAWAIGKSTHLDPHQSAPLLQAVGLMTGEGEIKAPMRRKFKQVNHFIELICPFLPREKSRKPYTIVDCGCGNSYLGFVLCWYIRHNLNHSVRFYGVDIARDRIDHCVERAKTLDLKEMSFECASNRDAHLPSSPDLLISLHACDTATDEALALGVAQHARHIAAAPCCQHEIARQIDGAPGYPISKHTIFKHRFADLLTDMARCLFLEAHGYSVTVGEFVSVDETPKNLLLRAQRGNRCAAKRESEYESFKQHYKIRPSLDTFLLELQAR